MLDKKESFKSIARELGRDYTTISKEIKNHIIFKKTGCFGHNFNDCLNKKDCTQKNLCSSNDYRYKTCLFRTFYYLYCADYQKQYCDKYNKSPYVCNGCENTSFTNSNVDCQAELPHLQDNNRISFRISFKRTE